MKKKQILFFACCLALGSSTMDLCAQRTMDKLGRGLVATVTQSGSGNFVSWRVLGEEYYDVAYNLYANGELRVTMSIREERPKPDIRWLPW